MGYHNCATSNEEKIFRFIIRCSRNSHKPDLHSFIIDIKDGKAYVDCRTDGVYVETHTKEGKSQFCGTAVAATNRLAFLGAIFDTIDM